MSKLTNGANNTQLEEIIKYISDNIRIPIISGDGGFAPVGTVAFFDATIAPSGWLACDGTVHKISDYPNLAIYYASVHGSANYYGGDGTTTFAVPNLQGEFLRGTGTNGHTGQGNGGSVGVHQDATTQEMRYGHRDSGLISFYDNKVDGTQLENTDGYASATGNAGLINVSGSATTSGNVTEYGYYARPTNTSFLICVKASVEENVGIDLVQTLTAGQTTIVFNSDRIRTDSTFEFFADVFGINIEAVTVTNGTLTLVFSEQQNDINIKVRVS